jgi:hypothetical protein
MKSNRQYLDFEDYFPFWFYNSGGAALRNAISEAGFGKVLFFAKKAVLINEAANTHNTMPVDQF